MRFEQFSDKHRNLNIDREEILRKWNIRKFEEEQYRLFESLGNRKGGDSPAPMIGSAPLTSSASSQLLVIKEDGAVNYTYYVFNYTDGKINGPHDTGVPIDSYDFGNSSQYLVNKKGFCHRFFKSSTNDFLLLFISATGEIIETIEGNTGDLSVSTLDGRYIVAWDYDLFTIWVFDGEKVYTDTTTVAGVDGYSLLTNWDNTNSEGFFMSSYKSLGGGVFESKVYSWKSGTFTEIFTIEHPSNIDVQYYSWAESNKIIIEKYNYNTGSHLGFLILNTSGSILQEIQLEDSVYNNDYFERFGTDKFYAIYYDSNLNEPNYKVYVYDAGQNILLETTVDKTTYTNLSVYHNYKSQSSFSDVLISENCYFVFYNATGNFNYNMSEVDYCKLVGFFDGQSNLVVADYAVNELKYVNITDVYTSNSYLLQTVDNDEFSLLKFNSTGILSNHTFTGFDAVNVTNVSNVKNDDRIVFAFEDNLTGFYHIYMINTDATEFIYLDENLSSWNYEIEYDTIIILDNTNDLAWYFNSVSTNWTSTTYYRDYNFPTPYSTSNGLSNGIISGYNLNRIYYFNDNGDGSTTSIDGGGDDMYDTGNYLNTNLGIGIPYTHTQMTSVNTGDEAIISDFIMDGGIVTGSGTDFGVGSSYFTNMYPGLFVMSASDVDITEFFISGNLGADGNGSLDSFQYSPSGYGSVYTAFVKRVWDANDPSINQVFIVDSDGTGITHNPSTDTNDDDNSISGLGSISKLHYLLFAKADGTKCTNEEIENIINSYLTLVDGQSLEDTLSALNTSYTTITNNLPPQDGLGELTIYTRDSINFSSINAYEDLDSGKDIFALWYYDPTRDGKVTMKVYNYSGNLLRTVESEDEIVYSFSVVENGVFLQTRTKYFEGETIIYIIDNYYHVSPKGYANVTVTLPDETNLYDIFNDYVWWD